MYRQARFPVHPFIQTICPRRKAMLLHQVVRFCFSATKVCFTGLLISAVLTSGFALRAEAQPLASRPALQSTVPSRGVATNARSLANGTYMYGESNQPGETGREYVVFENHGGMAVGAVFLTNSEYSCFSGQVNPYQLDMIVEDTYDNVSRPYAVSLESMSGETTTGLEYRSVQQIGQKEVNLLQICRQFYQDRFSKNATDG
jgi:hypothetical protein